MKTRKKRRGTGAFLLAVILAASVFTGVQAAEEVKTARDCSIKFSVPQFPDFGTAAADGGAEMTVKLYKVADMTASGTFGAKAAAFEKLNLPGKGGTMGTAAEWEALAKQAQDIVRTGGAEVDKVTAATVKITVGNGEKTETASGLKPGLYLVAAEKVESANYAYEMLPYLISLPNNAYLAGETGGSDAWKYENVESELKVEQTDLYGNLRINKTLNTYNTVLGPVTFLFQVEAVKADGRQQTKVYSNVAEIKFDGPGSKYVDITGIPAGAEVTVTEIPDGSYSPAAALQPVKILKNQSVPVNFTNDYNNGVIYRHTITNQFTNNNDGKGTWTWTQMIDGAATGKTKNDVQGLPPVIDTNPDGGTTGGENPAGGSETTGGGSGTTDSTNPGGGSTGTTNGNENAGGQ